MHKARKKTKVKHLQDQMTVADPGCRVCKGPWWENGLESAVHGYEKPHTLCLEIWALFMDSPRIMCLESSLVPMLQNRVQTSDFNCPKLIFKFYFSHLH